MSQGPERQCPEPRGAYGGNSPWSAPEGPCRPAAELTAVYSLPWISTQYLSKVLRLSCSNLPTY